MTDSDNPLDDFLSMKALSTYADSMLESLIASNEAGLRRLPPETQILARVLQVAAGVRCHSLDDVAPIYRRQAAFFADAGLTIKPV